MSKVAERRARMLDDIVDAAVAVMTESGAAGLSLGEMARRLGMRTPSLYGYVSSRSDLCDEVFRRGWEALNSVTATIDTGADRAPYDVVHDALTTVVDWALAHPAHAQLMFWRPIPGWQPSPDAFAPAVESVGQVVGVVAAFQARGVFRSDVSADEIAQVYAALSAGVISQQLSNEPGVPLDRGRASRHVAALAQMFVTHYQPVGGSS